MSQEARVGASPSSTLPLVEDVRRAREFYRYFEPAHLLAAGPSTLRRSTSSHDVSTETALLQSLAPFVQLAALKCHAQRALLSVTDRDTQYFLAEASCPSPQSSNGRAFEHDEGLLFAGGDAVPKKGRICETTIRLETSSPGTYPFFIVPDLSNDSRYAAMAIVQGPPYFRFYAGTPLLTRNGINIGSLCVMDTKVRQTLNEEEQQTLGDLATHVMSYLELNREAIEGRRAKRLSAALNLFIEGKSSYAEPNLVSRSRGVSDIRTHVPDHSSDFSGSISEEETPASGEGSQRRQNETNIEAVSYEKVFGRAANLLREAFELNDGGGVMFVGAGGSLKHDHSDVALHPTVGPESPSADAEDWPLASPEHQVTITTTFDPILNAFAKRPEHPAPLLASSTLEAPFAPADLLDGAKGTTPFQVDREVLHELFNRYPKGRLWIFDQSGLISASDEEHNSRKQRSRREAIKRTNASTWHRGDPTVLRRAFPNVRQLMFVPNWNAETSDWTSGCFVWSRNETHVLTSSTELSFLNSFTKTVMVELSRLDTMLADRQKGDFIGSISHELRSPLHGILASAEFLIETANTSFQRNLISTVDSCGRTLLDSINHLLDFSKINSFERNWRPKVKPRKATHGPLAKTLENPLPGGAPPLLRIYDITDVAAITEEVVEGITVGQIYSHGADITDITPQNRGRGSGKGLLAGSHMKGGRSNGPDSREERVKVIIDIDRADWLFMTQPGALRRVVMNLVGNATKYTTRGTINVRLRLDDLEEADSDAKMMVLIVTDTGRGISPAFLSSKLFVPFTQENPLMPGTGLGLSIVRSIVTMLGGSVDLRSRLGHGTTVEVRVPLQRPLPNSRSSTPRSSITQSTADSAGSHSKDNSIKILQGIAKGRKVAVYGLSDDAGSSDTRDLSRTLTRYLTDWFGVDVVALQAGDIPDVVLVEERDLQAVTNSQHFTGLGRRPALLILCINATRYSEAQAEDSEAPHEGIVEFVSKPCGPYKLAQALHDCMLRLRESSFERTGTRQSNGVPEYSALRPNGLPERLEELKLDAPGMPGPPGAVQGRQIHPDSQASRGVSLATSRLTTNGAGAGFPFPDADRRENEQPSSDTPVWPSLMQTEAQTQPPSDMPMASAGSISATLPTSPRILLVDDNKINLSLLKAYMKKRKYESVDLAEDGSIAVDAIKAAPEPYDIIFMDISMPVMNGFEATRAIREHERQSTPPSNSMIIALTGLASGRDQSQGFLAGCDIYMTKPVSFKEVGKLLDSWEANRDDSEGYHTPV